MRTLHKIIFINSASVQYAEIGLNGNVHLTGTQGVGKSTLLRAILFFYNSNKTRLGIPREKQSFDEYYFPYQNSYIIYEVLRDEIPYCVLAYKVNGKTAFRFIDSAYKRELFIDENNRAFRSWNQIREALGRDIYYTNLISGYTEFRQIIYGDNREMKAEFRKYSILESKQYQNIPLTIQNVFLNSKLEASFIKETIIKSIEEQEFSIGLENYRTHHLRDFENQIRDIQLWFQTNKKGIIPIRQQAKKIIDNHRHYIFINEQKRELAEDLAQRMAYIEAEKPVLNSTIQLQKTKLNELQEEQKRLEKLHRKREDDLNADIKILKTKLNEAKKKEEAYRLQGIYEIIQKVAQKEKWEGNKTALEQEKIALTEKFSDIRQKYKYLINQVENQLTKSKNDTHAAINEFEKKFLSEKSDLTEKYQIILTQLHDDFQKQINDFQLQLESYKQQENDLEKRKIELKYQDFFEEELKRNQKEKEKIEQSNREAIRKLDNAKAQKKILQKEGETKRESIEIKANNALEKAREKKEEILRVKDKIQQQLEKISSSLYGWLNENVPHWEDTIGKVISEEVLFQSDLHPQFSLKNSNDFYGLELNLNAIKSEVKSLDDYQKEMVHLQKQIEENQRIIHKLEVQRETDLSRIQKQYRKKINEFDDMISKADYQLNQNKIKAQRNEVERDEWIDKNKEKKKTLFKNIENQLNKLISEKLVVEKEIIGIQSRKNRNLSLKTTERDKKIAHLESEKDKQIEHLNRNFEAVNNQSEKRIEKIKIQQTSEFENKGADTQRIEEIDNQLKDIEGKLQYIKENEALVIEFNKDKREIFDVVPEWKADLKSKEIQQESILETHQQEKEKATKNYIKQKTIVEMLSEKLKNFTTDEERFLEFKKTSIFKDIEAYFKSDIKASEMAKSAVNSIPEISFKSADAIGILNRLKQNISLFSGNFNENNIFNFRTHFTADHAYLEFVMNLKEFIEENKIEEYEKRVSERFADIIRRLGNETQELISKEAEIEKVIRKINADFASKNFVEAIKEMEMRTRESSNPVVRLLLEIKKFNDENQLTLGGLNLFSRDDNTEQNKKAIELLKQLIKELDRYKKDSLSLSESFDLQFRIVENDNDSGWVEKLSHVGSEGTDVLVKAMINILLLNVFKSDASKKFKDFKLHCMMDEIGRLHPNNIKGILRFANERNIYLINGSPISQSATDYRYTYKLSKQQSSQDKKKYWTKVNRLIKMRPKVTTV